MREPLYFASNLHGFYIWKSASVYKRLNSLRPSDAYMRQLTKHHELR